MDSVTYTCPRCFLTAEALPDLRFCPRCGLPNVVQASNEASREADAGAAPLDLTVGRRIFRVLDRLAVGSICNVYRCLFLAGGTEREGVFKIARDAKSNGLVANEAEALRRLHAASSNARFTMFLPAVEESFDVGDEPADSGGDRGKDAGPARRANVLRMHEEVRSPDEFYTFDDVLAQYPAGIDPRDVAWIWRRMLSVLGFAHANGVVHGQVLPPHVLIEPRDHKLLLIDWCCAAIDPLSKPRPPTIISSGHLTWYKREGATTRPPVPALDVAFAARCVIGLLGGDPVRGECPTALDPALKRYFGRCLNSDSGIRSDAWKLLDDFDHLIEALWGPRTFRAFTMLPKQKPPHRS